MKLRAILSAAVLMLSAGLQAGNGLPMLLKGKVGVGFDSIPGASAGTGIIPSISTPNALSLRYWQSDLLAWDLLLAGDYSSQPGGADAAGNPIDNTTQAWGAGIKTKYNWKAPSENTFIQVVGRVSFASLSQDVTNAFTGRIDQTTQTLNIFLGLGVEAFIPWWQAISVEAVTGANVNSIRTTAANLNQSGSGFSLVGEGFTPLNLALHFYF